MCKGLSVAVITCRTRHCCVVWCAVPYVSKALLFIETSGTTHPVTASHLRRLECSATPLWPPRIPREWVSRNQNWLWVPWCPYLRDSDGAWRITSLMSTFGRTACKTAPGIAGVQKALTDAESILFCRLLHINCTYLFQVQPLSLQVL
jgi:hypothetical protein